MPTYSFAREASQASVDTLTALNGDFAGGTAATVIVPTGCSKIYKISASIGFGATAAAATGGLRLSGSGMVKEQNMVLVGANNIGTSVTSLTGPMEFDTDIQLIPGGVVKMEGWHGGGDTGTPEMGYSISMR